MPTAEARRDSGVTPAGRPRRQPVQSRSKQRLQRVVETTKTLVLELGPEPVTTTLIAERSGVSVAWIYQYFDDRQAIFDSIVLDASQRLFELTQQALLDALDGDWRAATRTALDVNVAFYAAEPAFLRLWNSPFRSAEMLRVNQLHDADQARWLYETLTRRGLIKPGKAAKRAFDLVLALADRGLELAFSRSRRGDRLVIDQLATALIAVLEPFSVSR